tara:strand:- start:218 stop:1768 length:1551 start_codon:yes stop_codon:yes gene_type:complete
MTMKVLDGSNIRTPHNIYALDGSTIRRVRQIKALDPDGSTIRDGFTKSDFFDVSGTASTLTPAVAEQLSFTINSIDNDVTRTTWTGHTSYSNSTYHQSSSGTWYGNGSGMPGYPGGQPSSPSYSGTYYNEREINGGQTVQVRWLSPSFTLGNNTSTGNGYVNFSINMRGWSTWSPSSIDQAFVSCGIYDGGASLHSGSYAFGQIPGTPHGNGTQFPYPSYFSTQYKDVLGTASSYSLANMLGNITNGTGGVNYVPWTWSYNSGNQYIPGLGSNGTFRVYFAMHLSDYGHSSVRMIRLNNPGGQNSDASFNAYSTQQTSSYYTNTSYSQHNGGASYSFSGPFSASGTFSQTTSTSTAGSEVRTAINNAKPSGWSVGGSGNTITITSPGGAQTDGSLSVSGGGGWSGNSSPPSGSSSSSQQNSTVSASGGVTQQGSNVSGSQTVATVNNGTSSTTTTLASGANTDTSGTAIASAMNGLSNTTASYDTGTNKITVKTAGDTSISLSNAGSLQVQKDNSL